MYLSLGVVVVVVVIILIWHSSATQNAAVNAATQVAIGTQQMASIAEEMFRLQAIESLRWAAQLRQHGITPHYDPLLSAQARQVLKRARELLDEDHYYDNEPVYVVQIFLDEEPEDRQREILDLAGLSSDAVRDTDPLALRGPEY